jgi:Ca2+-binding EF-hand superfamily protein
MSVSGISSSGVSSLWQLLKTLSSSSTESTSSSEASTTTATTTSSLTTSSDTSSSTSTQQLGAEVLAFLLSLQQIAPQNETDTESPVADLFSKIDTNGDGSLSSDEFSSFVQSLGGSSDDASQLYSALDSNGDGSVSEEELATILPPPPPPPPPTEQAAVDMIRSIDTDGDSTLSQQELDAFAGSLGVSSEDAQAFLQSLDGNGDGTLTSTELAQQLQSAMQTLLAQASSDTSTSKTTAGVSLVA